MKNEELAGTENFGIHTHEDPLIELEQHFLDYNMRINNIPPEEWIKRYAKRFRRLYNDPKEKIYEKFTDKKVYDENPDPFFEKLQQKIESMPEEEE